MINLKEINYLNKNLGFFLGTEIYLTQLPVSTVIDKLHIVRSSTVQYQLGEVLRDHIDSGMTQKSKHTTITYEMFEIKLRDYRKNPLKHKEGLSILQHEFVIDPYMMPDTEIRERFQVKSVLIPKQQITREETEYLKPLDLSVISDEANVNNGWFQVKLLDKNTGSTVVIRSRHFIGPKTAKVTREYFAQFT